MFASARKAAALVRDPAFFWLVLKALALTVLLFVMLFIAIEYGVHRLPVRHTASIDALIPILSYVLTWLLVMFLGAPVAALFASLFLEDIAQSVEKTFYPTDPPAGRAPFWRGLLLGLRLFLLLMLFQVLLLPLNVLAGLGALLSLLVNGWFLGRGYLEMVALRHLPHQAVDELRRRRASSITGAGLLIALLATIPLVNLVAPLFGVALMVHEFKRYTHEELRA